MPAAKTCGKKIDEHAISVTNIIWKIIRSSVEEDVATTGLLGIAGSGK
jgi:hypothetical protein